LKYRSLLDKASVLLSLHQFEEAKKIGEEALAINSMSADAYGVMVDAFVELGQYENAVIMADKMVSIRPDLRSYSRVSYLREIYGQVEGSIEAMKMAVAAGYPGMEQTEWARLTLGHLYERYGSLDSAVMQYEMALSVRPNYPFAIAALSNAMEVKGNTQLADSLNDVASRLIPEVGFFIDRANREKERGNVAVVGKLTEDVLKMLAEDEASGHSMSLELASVHMDLLDDLSTSLKYALKEYQNRPDNIDVNKLLAEIYLMKDDFNSAEKHLRVAMKTGSQDPLLKLLEGMLLLKSNNKNGEDILKQVFAEIPYMDCGFCNEAKAMII
jgi:tetratricopeptide (TPR) repeat protein